MKKIYFLFVLAGALFLSNSGLHPAANSGAPGDSFCGACHSGGGGSLNGEVQIIGLPTNIQPNTTYPLSVTVTNPAMNASRAGFQIVALNQSNFNSGTFSNFNNSTSELRMQGGRTYFGHKPAQFFNGSSSVTWTVDWTSPAGSGDQITIYGAAVIANGANGNSGDRAVLTNESGNIAGSTPLTVTVTEDFPTLCFDSNDGIATALPSGGQAPYEYQWDNGSTNMQATNLTAGNHDVTVTDALNATATGSVFINSPSELTITNSGQEDVSCFGEATGLAQFDANGGTPNYTFNWSDGGTGSERSDLLAGFYTITVTDNNGCNTSTSVTIDEANEIEAIETINDVLCNGESNGSIFINPSGGTGSFSFDWSNGSNNQNQFDLNAGFYEVTITDDNNCQVSFQYEVVEPLGLTLNIDNTNDVSCANSNDGIGDLSGNGGIGPYTYSWSDGGNGSSRNDLSVGKYYITISDQNSCTNNDSLTIGAPPSIVIDSTTSIAASCSGVADGSLEISASGGNGNFTYLWSNGDMTNAIENITSGSYTVTVTDSQNCTAERTISLGALAGATISLDTVINLACFGDSNGIIQIEIEDGTDYTIDWSNGNEGLVDSFLPAGNYDILATNPSGCQSNPLTVEVIAPGLIALTTETIQNPLCFGEASGSINLSYQGGSGNLTFEWENGATSDSLPNLIAGQYIISVTDENNCVISDTFDLTNPEEISIDTSFVFDLLCFDDSSGMIEVVALGGTGNLNYQWSNGDTTSMIETLMSNNYSVTINDENNCTLSNEYFVDQPEPIIINGEVENESVLNAADGSIKIIIEGGTPVYDILWSTGEMVDSITDLSSGQYTVTITDNNNCVVEKSFQVSQGDCQLMATASTTDVNCFGESNGSISLDIINNEGPVSFSISNGITQLDSLPAGDYEVIITDTALCSITLSNLTINQPDPIQITVDSVQDVMGSENGRIEISVSGGTGGFTFIWKDTNGNDISSDEDIEGIPSGLYSVVVTDLNGCSQTIENIEVKIINNTIETPLRLDVFPNPATDLITIESNIGITTAHLINTQGQVVLSSEKDRNIVELNVSDIKAGIYFIKVYSNKEYRIYKISIL